MRLRRWILSAGLTASLFSLTPASAFAEETLALAQMDSTNLYGSWTWLETVIGSGEDARIGTPAYCGCARTLEFHRDGTYEVMVSDIRGPRELSSGKFVIHCRNPLTSARIWLEFMETDPKIQPAVQIHFAGRDTIVTSDGMMDSNNRRSPVRRFTRSQETRHPRGRAPAQATRPPRLIGSPPNEYGSFPAETDSSYDVPPTPILRVPAVPGEFAREAGFSGDVLLRVLVQPDGRVAAVKVLKGSEWLRGSAMDSAWKWRFRPAGKNRHATQAWTRVVITVPLDPKPVIRKD